MAKSFNSKVTENFQPSSKPSPKWHPSGNDRTRNTKMPAYAKPKYRNAYADED